MRRCGRNPEFITENSNILGILLPADYTAEHEWGIKRLKQSFGIQSYDPHEGPVGLARRKATKTPELYFERKGNTALLIAGSEARRSDPRWDFTLAKLPSELSPSSYKNEKDVITGAWDEASLAVYTTGKKNCDNLERFKNAIEKQEVALFMSGQLALFENPGLVLSFDKLPKAAIEAMEKGDEDTIKLYTEARKTGIVEKIDASGKKSSWGGQPYFALSPSWISDRKKHHSKYKVMYWLNPTEQQDNNYGYFTVEDLEKWLEGKGPIPMTKKNCTN